MSESVNKVIDRSLDKAQAAAVSEEMGILAAGWGVLMYEGGDGRSDVTTVVTVKAEEERARQLADFLRERESELIPNSSDPDAFPEYFKRFGVAQVALLGADVVTTFQYETIPLEHKNTEPGKKLSGTVTRPSTPQWPN